MYLRHLTNRALADRLRKLRETPRQFDRSHRDQYLAETEARLRAYPDESRVTIESRPPPDVLLAAARAGAQLYDATGDPDDVLSSAQKDALVTPALVPDRPMRHGHGLPPGYATVRETLRKYAADPAMAPVIHDVLDALEGERR